jgi:hypothetical protein
MKTTIYGTALMLLFVLSSVLVNAKSTRKSPFERFKHLFKIAENERMKPIPGDSSGQLVLLGPKTTHDAGGNGIAIVCEMKTGPCAIISGYPANPIQPMVTIYDENNNTKKFLPREVTTQKMPNGEMLITLNF